MSKLEDAVAAALMVDLVAWSAGKVVALTNLGPGIAAKKAPGWLEKHEVAERLIDANGIATQKIGTSWIAIMDCAAVSHQDRRTAALMAFCKHKGVAYE